MMNRSEILEVLKNYKEANSRKYRINKIGIFGSFAKGAETEQSDIDVVIEVAEPDIFILVHIKDEPEKLLNSTVDIIRNRENMNPYLKERIEREAIYVW